MSVVFLRSNPVNPDSRVEKEANSLIKAGYEVEIVAWDRSAKYKIKTSFLNLNSGRVKISRFGIPATFGGGVRRNLLALIEFQIKLFKWLYKNRNSFDVIHACDFDTAYTAFQFSRQFKKKIVYDIFDYYVDAFGVPGFLKPFIEKKDKKIINNSDAVIICNEKRKEQIKGTNPKRLVVLHNSPSKGKEDIKGFVLNNSKVKIVYVGILDNGRFIKEIADFVKSNTYYEFHIGGFGKLEGFFEKMATKYNNIIFYGKLPYNKTLELENSCDIMIAIYDPNIPNHYYAAPNKFYESLMLGKPLIMVKNTGMSEVVQKENIGELIEYDMVSFQRALSRIVDRREEWQNLAAKMKKIYSDKYSWKIMEERLLSLYSDI